jgi:hypothetical protein
MLKQGRTALNRTVPAYITLSKLSFQWHVHECFKFVVILVLTEISEFFCNSMKNQVFLVLTLRQIKKKILTTTAPTIFLYILLVIFQQKAKKSYDD